MTSPSGLLLSTGITDSREATEETGSVILSFCSCSISQRKYAVFSPKTVTSLKPQSTETSFPSTNKLRRVSRGTWSERALFVFLKAPEVHHTNVHMYIASGLVEGIVSGVTLGKHHRDLPLVFPECHLSAVPPGSREEKRGGVWRIGRLTLLTSRLSTHENYCLFFTSAYRYSRHDQRCLVFCTLPPSTLVLVFGLVALRASC